MYTPTIAKSKDLVNLVDSIKDCDVPGFDIYYPDPTFEFTDAKRGVVPNSEWKTIKPEKAPPVDPTLPKVIQDMVKSTWKRTTPSSSRHGMNFLMGSRPLPPGINVIEPVYTPVVRPTPTNPHITVTMNDATIANDWHLFNGIKRKNAITFRGDSRTPNQVIAVAGGFSPPNTRTDDYYLKEAIFPGFNDYFNRRYGRTINKQDFLQAVKVELDSPNKTQMFFDYMSWRGLMKSEASHLGRMAANECLKGYISTSRSIDSSNAFGCKSNMSKEGYYIYVTQVNSGFVVPENSSVDVQWGTGEAEIAQLGKIPKERILGYRKFVRGEAVGAIHMRASFREKEPIAFGKTFKILSGAKPNDVIYA